METPTPDGSSDADLKDRVVAWHNRSLLTCRIRADQVTGIGIVALPFSDSRSAGTAPHGRLASLRARIDTVLAPLTGRFRNRRKSAAVPLFNEDFIPPLKPKAVARFARRHSDAQQPGSTAWPKRKVRPTQTSGRHTRRYLRTAAIEYGGRRVRVLIGSGAEPRIIGPRLWSRRRLAGVLAGFGLFVSGSMIATLWPVSVPAESAPRIALSAPTEHPPPPGAAETHAPEAASSTVGAPPPAALAAARAEAPGAAPDEAAAIAPAAPSAPVSNVAARPEAEADRSAPVDRANPADSASPPTPAKASPAQARPAEVTQATSSVASVPIQVADDEPRFALAAAPTRSRVSSMLRLSLLNFPTEPRKNGVHAELMQAGAAWRVVIWPYPTREAAEQAQNALRQRGVKVELIAF